MNYRCDKTQDIFGDLMTPAQIKAILKEKGWTQVAVAEYWDTSKDYISELVTNRTGKRKRWHDCAFGGLPRKK